MLIFYLLSLRFISTYIHVLPLGSEFILGGGSDRCMAVGLVYTALSALLHCGLSQLGPFAPQLNLIDPSRAGKPPRAGAAVYPATYRH